MQSQKKFVKYTNFNVSTPTQRDTRRPSKKNYYEKIIAKGDAVKSIINVFAITPPSAIVKQLITKFPKFFAPISKNPEKEKQENLNEFLVFNLGKRGGQQAKLFENESSDDPNWQSGSQGEFKLESKKIDIKIIEKVAEKVVVPLIKNELKKHEKQFLEDYLKSKNKSQQQNTTVQGLKNTSLGKQIKQSKQKNNSEKITDNNQFQKWLNLGKPNISGGCWIQKIEEDIDDGFNDLEIGQDDGMFDRESSKEKSSSTSSDQDDGFVDQTTSNTTLHTANKTRNKTQGSVTVNQYERQGMVYINSYVFSGIAQKAGVSSQHCIWQISNHKFRYKVSTQYMDQIYRQNNINKEYPYIALNLSQFVHNDDADTPKSIEIFKKQQKKTNYKKYKEVDHKFEKHQKNTEHTHKKKK